VVTNMRIALLHDSLNSCGGAERLALAFARALKELGHSVDLFVLEPTLWEKIETIMSINRNVIDHEHVLFPIKGLLSLRTLYNKFPLWFLRDIIGAHMVRSRNYDLIITTKQILVPVFTDILYIHFPNFVIEYYYLYYPDKSNSTLYRIYLQPLELLLKPLLLLSRGLDHKPLILTNSRFSAFAIRKFLGMNCLVLYPPIELEKYLPLFQNIERKNLVVTLSRIEPLKNIEVILDIARETKTVNFIIAGTIGSINYYSALKRKIKALGLEERVKILPNIEEEVKRAILKISKIYLHPMKYEHFGIAVVEAMASGLIPVVHKSGGVWMDIVEYGKYGFGFRRIDEAVEYINSILEMNESELQNWRSKLLEKVKIFSYDVFKSNIERLIKALSKFKNKAIEG
jgi:glycosyltransferase involved in cell wall biosynthesis